MKKKSKVLVVDDDMVNGKYLSKQLLKEDLETEFLSDGTKCVETVMSGDFDLVLLDVIMPNITGVEILRKLRETYQPLELPIIMVTARDETDDIVEALNLGANDYLTKPVNVQIAKARVSNQLMIKNFYLSSIEKKKLETLNAMIITYNHEINNPLAIAMGNLKENKDDLSDKNYNKIREAIERITDIVKKIDNINQGTVEFESYAEGSLMIKAK
ncbi:MAG: response regulator [Halobacteriovoraceae bacterium]|nr:response regulator [Halobacteriovoraceae bacterium]